MKYILLFLSLLQFTPLKAQTKTAVNPINRVGDTITITGRIIAGNFLVHVKTKPTFLNLWDSLPNHRMMVRIEPEDRAKFSSAPEKLFLNQKVSVTGVVENYKGTALIRVADSTMIKLSLAPEMETPSQRNNVFKNKVTPTTPSPIRVPDSVLQREWVNRVATQSIEQSNKDIRIVQKEIPLRVSPNEESPIIAELEKGIAVSVLYKSRRWSYIAVRKPDGTSSVFGFIKNRRFKHLKKEKTK